MVVVCAECLKASCLLGVFLCEGYRTAGVVEKTVGELNELKLEHPFYWEAK